MPDLSRRAVLRLGVGAAAGAVGAYAWATLRDQRPGVDDKCEPALRWPRTPGAAPTARRRSSAARSSRRRAAASQTNWAIARPPGQTAPLRPVIALHGKGANAAEVMAGGVEQGLAQAVDAGLPPFAVVAVDGGGSYWHKRASGEDSGAMVLDELIPMLGSAGPGHLAGRLPRLVDGRLRRAAARRAAGPGPHRRDLRGQPGAVDIVRCGGARRVRRRRRLRGQQRVGAAASSRRYRSGSTAATAIRSIRRRSSSSRSCRIRPRAGSPPADTTAGSGVRNYRPSWIGWRRCCVTGASRT